MEKFTRRKRKRGIWFLFSFLESPRFSLHTKEKISVKHMYKKLDKKRIKMKIVGSINPKLSNDKKRKPNPTKPIKK
jgi:hypothetical protein